MTQPISGKAPPPHIESTAKHDQEKLKEVVDKVSSATGIPSQKEAIPAKPIMPTANPALSPDTKKAATAVKQSVGLEGILKMPPEIRSLFLKDLSDEALQSFEDALSKGSTIKADYQTSFESLKKQIAEIKEVKKQLLTEILTDHPEWRSQVEAWKNVSLENKIWLLQLFELRNLGVKIPQIKTDSPSELTPELLQANVRAAIAESLSKVIELNLSQKKLARCPQAISLLPNLHMLDLSENRLTSPPDVSKNVHLEELYLGNNQLKDSPDVSKNNKLKIFKIGGNSLTTPPDISKNIDLESFDIAFNQLITPPDVSQNTKLLVLDISHNQLTTPPNVDTNIHLKFLNLAFNQLKTAPIVRKNIHLIKLELDDNKLIVPPDISKNVSLEHLNLCVNQLKNSPDVQANVNLKFLNLHSNQITIPPDTSKNVHLELLWLGSNQLTSCPDVSKNDRLNSLSIEKNPLTKQAVETLEKLKGERKTLTVYE